MTYRTFILNRGKWQGRLDATGWARFYEGKGSRWHVSMKAIAATQAQAEAYVKAKVESLARGEPVNKYIEVR